MQWGRQKSLDWLQTFLLSFVQNVLVVQPAKVSNIECHDFCQDLSITFMVIRVLQKLFGCKKKKTATPETSPRTSHDEST
jgi:hypothetical protein